MKTHTTKIIILLTLLVFAIRTFANQDTINSIKLNLNEVIALATDSSIEAFIAQNNYLAQYWIYESYKAGKLPFLDMNSTVADLSKTYNKQFNSNTKTYEYFEQKDMVSSLNLSLNQNITKTGGLVFIDSDLSRLQNLKQSDATQYSATIIRIGIEQKLFDFNPNKWNDQINPLQFERAKLELVYNYEEIASKAVEYFFMLANAQVSYQIAKNNFANADTLYKIGKKKLKIAGILKEDLFSLQLELVNANNEIKTALKDLNRAKRYMSSFLRLGSNPNIELILPEDISETFILKEKAMQMALQYNPQILEIQQKRIEAERDVEKAKKESRLSGTVSASFGLNKSALELNDTYTDPIDQELVKFDINLPIIDWGLAKGNYNMALRRKEANFLLLDQKVIDLEQDIYSAVEEYNIQNSIVEGARLADSIARVTHNMIIKRFLLGDIDITRLNNAVSSTVSAKQNYINAIQKYWQYYYNLRKLTLYNFMEEKPLVDNFGETYIQLVE